MKTTGVYVGVICLISILAVITAICFPFKECSLSLGDFGHIEMRVARFSDSGELRLNKHWIPVVGTVLPEAERDEVRLEPETPTKDRDGVHVRVQVHNPTSWHVTSLLIGFTGKTSPGSLLFVNCDVASFSASSAVIALDKTTDPGSLKRLLVLGTSHD